MVGGRGSGGDSGDRVVVGGSVIIEAGVAIPSASESTSVGKK